LFGPVNSQFISNPLTASRYHKADFQRKKILPSQFFSKTFKIQCKQIILKKIFFKMETRLCFLVIILTVLNTRTVETANLGCQQVKYAFTTKGLHANNIPSTPQTGEHFS
jgi:hypothetical protein